MKRFLTLFTLPLLFASCSENVETPAAAEQQGDEVVRFSASLVEMTQSRVSLKFGFGNDDQVAIFVESEEGTSEPYIYDVDNTGKMTVAEGGEAIIRKQNSTDEVTYHAFYPVKEELTTVEEYEAITGTDLLIAEKVASSTSVALKFEHVFAAVSVLMPFDGDVDTVEVSITAGGETFEPEAKMQGDDFIISAFVNPVEDLTGAILMVNKSIYSLCNDEVTKWEAGHSYVYME